jgi:sugar phosphate isomerase/epimerase
MPQLAIGSWAFAFGPFETAPWPFDRVLRYAANAGYDGIEINGFRPHPHPDDYNTPEKCRALIATVQGYGLGISGYAPSFAGLPPSEVAPEEYLRFFRKALAFCTSCDIQTLRVDTVSPPQALPLELYEKRFARLAATWRAASEEAQRAGVLVVWEFEPGFWLNKLGEVLRLVEAVGHPNFRLIFDTSHAYMGAVVGARHSGDKELLPGGVAEYARRLLPYIGHLHLIDSDGTLHGEETSTHTPFGAGHVDFRAVMEVLRPVAAKLPWWCVDLCFNADAEAAGRAAVPFVRSLTQAVA